MGKISKAAIAASSFSIIFPLKASAMCPVCTIAIGAGLGISRWLGISDLVTATWIGGFLVSLSMWTIDWLKRKNWKFRYYKIAVFAAMYILTIIPLYFTKVIGIPGNTTFGIDNIILGIIAGTIAFSAAAIYYLQAKKKNGKPHFPFEKVVLTFGATALMSLIMHFISK